MPMIPRSLIVQPAQARIAGYGDVSPTLGPEDIVGFYNSGFSSALGGIFKSIGGAAIGAGATVAIGELTKLAQRAVASGHPSAAAAGPTAHPVLNAAPASVPTEISHAIMHPIQTAMEEMGFSHARGARYAPAGTKGYHMIKRGPHAGLWTKNRHRNVCNPRALRRAISRAHGFARLAMKTIHLVHPRKKGRFGGFRGRRKSR